MGRRRRSRTERPKYPLPRLRAYALRALARRSHARAELRHKLAERAAQDADVEALMARFEQAGLLDDRRFALEFARFRSEHRRLGRNRLRQELRQRGVSDRVSEEALDEVFADEEHELRLVRRRIDQRLSRKPPPYDVRIFRSLYSALLRAGFPSAIIRDELFRRPEFSQVKRTPGRL